MKLALTALSYESIDNSENTRLTSLQHTPNLVNSIAKFNAIKASFMAIKSYFMDKVFELYCRRSSS